VGEIERAVPMGRRRLFQEYGEGARKATSNKVAKRGNRHKSQRRISAKRVTGTLGEKKRRSATSLSREGRPQKYRTERKRGPVFGKVKTKSDVQEDFRGGGFTEHG